MDDECAICCRLKAAQIPLLQLSELIDLSCANQKKKRDFGLDKSFVEKELATIKQMMKYHTYWHVNGESLNDPDIVYGIMDNNKPKRFRNTE